MRHDEYQNIADQDEKHWMCLGRAEIMNKVLNRFNAGGSILDVGCGTGYISKLLKQRGDVKCLDINNEAIRICRERGLNIEKGGVENIPYPENSFDLVVCMDVLYHREVKNEEAALKELKRVLRPGGYLLIFLPAHMYLFGSHDRAEFTRRRYEKNDVLELFKKTGLEMKYFTFANFFLFPVVYFRRKFMGESEQSDFVEMPRIINWLLLTILRLEAWWISMFSFPNGVAIVCLGKKI
ncbi:MAG: class I SAM-dependent methyltransferase [Candidatus Niyogibacteria bacterium]|nr:class I SAM-dependent methyltransferase [Candidatus Niyogibacteria bacterium]